MQWSDPFVLELQGRYLYGHEIQYPLLEQSHAQRCIEHIVNPNTQHSLSLEEHAAQDAFIECEVQEFLCIG